MEEGSTFVFVSGLGKGWTVLEIKNVAFQLHIHMAVMENGPKIYTSDQDAKTMEPSRFVLLMLGDSQTRLPYCYFKNIDGRIVDAFTITNFLGTHSDTQQII